MAAKDLLQPRVETTPVINAYSDTRYPGALKVGFPARDIVRDAMRALQNIEGFRALRQDI